MRPAHQRIKKHHDSSVWGLGTVAQIPECVLGGDRAGVAVDLSELEPASLKWLLGAGF